MKNKSINFKAKNVLTNCSLILLLLSLTSVISCATVQYGFDARGSSKFSTFDDLGIAKEEFIKQYGTPTNKGLYQMGTDKKIEKLYYTEQIKSFLVTTAFIFENNILKLMKRVETRNNFPEGRE